MTGLAERPSQQHLEKLDLLNRLLGVRVGLLYAVKEPALSGKQHGQHSSSCLIVHTDDDASQALHSFAEVEINLLFAPLHNYRM